MVPGDRHTPMAGSLPVASDDQVTLELSVVIPCLNEAGTIQHVLETAQRVITDHHISAEVVVANNGSTDGSQVSSVGAPPHIHSCRSPIPDPRPETRGVISIRTRDPSP